MLVGKDGAEVLLVLSSLLTRIEHQVKSLIGLIALHRLACPEMLVGGVIEDEVEHQADALTAEFFGE